MKTPLLALLLLLPASPRADDIPTGGHAADPRVSKTREEFERHGKYFKRDFPMLAPGPVATGNGSPKYTGNMRLLDVARDAEGRELTGPAATLYVDHGTGLLMSSPRRYYLLWRTEDPSRSPKEPILVFHEPALVGFPALPKAAIHMGRQPIPSPGKSMPKGNLQVWRWPDSVVVKNDAGLYGGVFELDDKGKPAASVPLMWWGVEGGAGFQDLPFDQRQAALDKAFPKRPDSAAPVPDLGFAAPSEGEFYEGSWAKLWKAKGADGRELNEEVAVLYRDEGEGTKASPRRYYLYWRTQAPKRPLLVFQEPPTERYPALPRVPIHLGKLPIPAPAGKPLQGMPLQIWRWPRKPSAEGPGLYGAVHEWDGGGLPKSVTYLMWWGIEGGASLQTLPPDQRASVVQAALSAR